MGGEIPVKLSKLAARQAGVVTRQQARDSGMSAGDIDAQLKRGEWQQVHRAVYATFIGPLSRRAQLWAALLYGGRRAVLSHETAGEIQWLIDEPSGIIHVTVPASRRVKPAPGVRFHVSELVAPPIEVRKGVPPTTPLEHTIIDLAQSCQDPDAVYALVTGAFRKRKVHIDQYELLLAIASRRRLRWRAELVEVTIAGADGAHSVLEFRWDRDVVDAHGLPRARKQVPFMKADGSDGFRDREYPQWRLIIELDGKEWHQNEARQEADRVRDRQASRYDRSQTMRFGWRETRYEACKTAKKVIWALWDRGWRGRPKPCSPDCPVAGLLEWLDEWLAASPARQREWLKEQAAQEAAAQAEATRLASRRAALWESVEHEAAARKKLREPQTNPRRGHERQDSGR